MSYIDPAGKVFQHLDRLAALKRGRPRSPINIEIDLSNRCSLGCDWCHFAYTHTRGPLKDKRAKPAGAIPGGDLMDTALATRIVEQFALAGVESITWTGGGEPTLHPDFDRIVAFAADWTQQGIYTHGGHIDEKRAALLKRAMTFVYVSLDAANDAQYQRDKGVPAKRFHDACRGVKNLVAAKGEATIGVGYLVTRDNWRSVDYAAELAYSLGADYIQFRPTIQYAQDTPGEPSEDTSWLDEAIPFLERVENIWPRKTIVDVERFQMYRDWNGHGYSTCWWSGLQSVVTPNGKMWTCVNKREHPAAEIGDLSHESFRDIWARQKLANVDGSCRVMCRGHIANKTVDKVMTPVPHPEFV